jgi:hypothetical protein
VPPARKAAAGGAASGRPGEVRLPAALAVVVAAVLYATLPGTLLTGPRIVVPIIELALLVPLVAVNPYRMTRQDRRLRVLALVLCVVLIVANAVAFGLLLHALIETKKVNGNQLLLGALQVWTNNIIAFALMFWELDRGGPVTRRRTDRAALPSADFRFSQDEDADTVHEVSARSSEASDWRPGFVDYLYVSVTNSTAFSPTDTMPLSPRAKILMSAESIQALLMSILVIARGVSLIH